MADWFASWFNTSYYHTLYKHRNDDEAEAFITHIVEALHIKKGEKVLDVACGKGRHARFLSSFGLDVTGIDLSEESIKAARKHEHHALQFEVHDMRKVYKENSFDVVTNMFTSFGYFDDEADDQTALQAMADALKPGGQLVFDFINAHRAIENLVPAESKEIDGINFDIRRSVQDNFIIKDIIVKDGSKAEQAYQERVKALMVSDLRSLMAQAGLTIMKQWGDYHLNGFDANTSPRVILVAKKI